MEVDSSSPEIYPIHTDPVVDSCGSDLPSSNQTEKPQQNDELSKSVDLPDKNILSAVLQICRKYNLKVSFTIHSLNCENLQ